MPCSAQNNVSSGHIISNSSPGIPAGFLILMVALMYAFIFYPVADDNENSRFDLVYSIVEHGTINIDRYEDNTQDKAYVNGHYYSDKPVLPAFLGVLAYYPVYKISGESGISRAAAQYIIRTIIISIPSIFGVYLLFRLLVLFGLQLDRAFITALFYALGTAAFPYSTVFQGHLLCGVLLLCAYHVIATNYSFKTTIAGPKSFFTGLLLGFAAIVQFESVICVPLFMILIFSHEKRIRWLFWFLPGFIIAVIPQLIYNNLCFGSPWTLAYSYHVLPHRGVGFMGLVTPSLTALYGIILSPFRGLFFYSPFLVFFIPGLFLLFRNSMLRHMLFSLCCITGFVVVNISLVDWEGGACAGPRYLVPIIPFIIIAMVPVIKRMGSSGYLIYRVFGWASVFTFLIITITNVNLPLGSMFPLREITLYLLKTGEYNLVSTHAGFPYRQILTFIPFIVPVIILFASGRICNQERKYIIPGTITLLCSLVMTWTVLHFPFRETAPVNRIYFGEHFMRRGNLDAALMEFNQAQTTDQYTWKLNYLKGEIFRENGDIDTAVSMYFESIRLNPDYFAPFYRLGIIALRSEKYTDAEGFLEKALRNNDRIPEIHNNLGIAYVGLGKYDRAEIMFRQALDIKPAYAQAWFNLGNLYFQFRNSPDSINYLKKCVELDPGFKPAVSMLEDAERKFGGNMR